MNYLIRIAYDGSKFNGFQRLNEEKSVQAEIENALTIINKSEVRVKGAGRTDRGVHANGQCVSFKLDVDINPNGLRKALNSLLEPYIYVKSVKEVDESFHARFSVKRKTYIYKINLGEYNPCLSDYVYQCKYKLDVSKMKEVSKLYLGVHDFHNFVCDDRDDYKAIIYSIDFYMTGDILNIKFVGKSFYRYMVRNLVGEMVEVARGKKKVADVENMLVTSKKIFPVTIKANGLYLDNIEY